MSREVLILSTGGTIEKSYCEAEGSLTNRSSQLERHLLTGLRLPKTSTQVREILAKDSLEMTTDDRQLISDEIQKYQKEGRGLVVLHGTDTMDLTLEHLCSQTPAFLSAVVFTGAMRPATLVDSDARQNFTEALLLAQFLPPGVYLSFHSQVFVAPGVRKNKALGSFEATGPAAQLSLALLSDDARAQL